MLHALKLLLPALIPSWRFFDTITPSPRIEYIWRSNADDAACDWQLFRPHPQSISLSATLLRLFWNPRWNETLFLASCAERLLDTPTARSSGEIATRIRRDLPAAAPKPYFQFRLVLVSRDGAQLARDIAYVSQLYPA